MKTVRGLKFLFDPYKLSPVYPCSVRVLQWNDLSGMNTWGCSS